MRFGSGSTTSSSLDRSIKLRVILGNTITDDHELTEETANSCDNRLAILRPTINLSDFLLKNLLDWGDLVYILLFDFLT